MREKKIEELRQIRQLYKKHKGLLKARKELVELNQPIVMVIRKNRKVEIYEGATSGKYTYERSDGIIGEVTLDPQFLLTFPYGDKVFHGYLIQEDEQYPLPHKPIAYSEQITSALMKVANDLERYKAGKHRAYATLIKTIGFWVAILFGIFVLGRMLVPDLFQLVRTEEVVKTVVANATPTVKNVTIF